MTKKLPATVFVMPKKQVILVGIVWCLLLTGCAMGPDTAAIPKELPLLQKWNGDYPVFQLGQLPEGQYMSRVGFITNAATFSNIWQAFKPGESLPLIDFRSNIVVFTRNVEFYNRTSILKVLLTDSIVEIISLETMTALPIGDKVAMALAVVPRAGIKFMKLDGKLIAVTFR